MGAGIPKSSALLDWAESSRRRGFGSGLRRFDSTVWMGKTISVPSIVDLAAPPCMLFGRRLEAP